MGERTSGIFESLFDSVHESDKAEALNEAEEIEVTETPEEPEVEEGCGKHKKAKKVIESEGVIDVEALKMQYKLINREIDFGSLVTEDLELMDGLNSFLQDTIERAGGDLDTVMRPGIKQEVRADAAKNQQDTDREDS